MTATTASDALDARLAMEIRLLGLEARITGNSPYSESDALSGPGVRRGGGGESIDSEKTVMRRVHDIKQGIETAGEGSDSMKRFLANYDSYKSLLTIPGTHQTTANDTHAPTDASSDGEPPLNEADLIPAKIKRTMVLESARDIQALERDLRRVEGFRDRDVAGAGELEELIKLSGALKQREAGSRARSARTNGTRREVGQVLKRYNDYNATVSDLFLEIHHSLEALEDQIARAERKKRKDLEGRY